MGCCKTKEPEVEEPEPEQPVAQVVAKEKEPSPVAKKVKKSVEPEKPKPSVAPKKQEVEKSVLLAVSLYKVRNQLK